MTREVLDLTAALRPRLPSPLQPVEDERFTRHGIRLLLKRDDLIHPVLPGNKWRKLAPNLRAAAGRPVLTFGGAYSNHLRATAAAGRLLGFPTIGIVRGAELADRPLNPSLSQCAADGMHLLFVDRALYRRKAEPEVLAEIVSAAAGSRSPAPAGPAIEDLHEEINKDINQYIDKNVDEDLYVVPEGGSNALAAQGCTHLGRELHRLADVVAVACGTGGTLAGLAAGLGPGQRALGFPVLKGGFLGDTVEDLQRVAFGGRAGVWSLEERFHFGGYARTTTELSAFAEDFEARHRLPVERVYVAKMLYGLTALAAEGAFPPGTTVAAVITGREPSR
ncbi:pyridoxal-phosphate dependent enzyme [Streptomyces sp. NBC_01142]|uniref:1-aminocyclopropane-1-carboxylate deaminase/D-cysteine desulfhydrase n=1 Tax=Streptomyces sp. NBC_01142 TaxID=2975865 RepID=UPI00224CF084|nr:pyridoxal-phosphate dependent enzyme [Streptomyces sp. NBC_01142]MCX4819296.1 pyridoxal-phosphate dependent enzyme [Streptomyces sp. NBC_01142]